MNRALVWQRGGARGSYQAATLEELIVNQRKDFQTMQEVNKEIEKDAGIAVFLFFSLSSLLSRPSCPALYAIR
ncbi:MAG TPA: hypothetical protein VEI46_05960 [Thermodesulfovibrionales bacterium]|nr:hypothetical protein [Thermodesulfovibrionales bacterium]